MLGLILVVLVIVRIVYCIWRKKRIFDSSTFVFCIIVLGIFISATFGMYLGTISSVKNIPKYQEANQVIEAQMQELRNDFINWVLENPEQSKENFEAMLSEFIGEYSELEAKFDANNEFIDRLLNVQENGLPGVRFLLYFGH